MKKLNWLFIPLLAISAIVWAAGGFKDFPHDELRFGGSAAGVRTLTFDQSPDGSSAKITVDPADEEFNLNHTANITGVVNTSSTTDASIPCPVMTEVQRDAIASPADGMCVFNSDTGKLNTYDVDLVAWLEAGAAAGVGGINYIDNYDIEINATGYNAYQDVAGENAVDGTGGSPSITVARNTTTPLRGDGDLKLTKDGANRQGEGYAYDFTISKSDQAQIQTISFEYDASDANYVDGDIRIQVYDVTNAKLIRVNGEDLKGGKGKHYARFQTAPDSTSYRLIFHIATVNASIYNIYFEQIQVGPQVINHGTIVTNTKDLSVTISNIPNSANDFKYVRRGDRMFIDGSIDVSGAVTGTMQIDLDNFTPDQSKITLDGGGSAMVGTVRGRDITGSAVYVGEVYINSSGNLRFRGDGGINVWNATVPFTWVSGDYVSVQIEMPIEGWSSNAAQSSDFSGRDVVVSASGNGGGSYTANTPIEFNVTESIDNTASWDGDEFTVPETGYYSISGSTRATATTTWVHLIYVNGVQGKSIGRNDVANIIGNFAGIEHFNKGEVVSIRHNGAVTLNNDPTYHHIHIQKLASPQTMFENELVAASYNTNSQSISANTTIIYEDIDGGDSHGAYNVSTGIYTAESSGWYDVSASLYTQSVLWASGQFIEIRIEVESVVKHNDVTRIETAITQAFAADVDGKVYMNKGDELKIVGNTNRGSTALITSGYYNTFSITKVK